MRNSLRRFFNYLIIILALSAVSNVDLLSGWRAAVVNPTNSNDFLSVCNPTSTYGYAINRNGVMYKTQDNGENWYQLNYSFLPSNTYSIYFTDENYGWVTGSFGRIFITTNGGSTWEQKYYISSGFLGMHFSSRENGIAVGSTGVIRYTRDGGNSWSTGASNTTDALYAVHCIDNNNSIAVGVNGRILKSTDGGATWNSRSTGTYTLYSVYFANTTTGYAVGAQGIVLKTTDAGENWSVVRLPQTTYSDLNDVYVQICPEKVYAVGNLGTIIQSTNGGVSWATQTPGTGYTTYNFYSIDFSDNLNGCIAAQYGTILKTSDASDGTRIIVENISGAQCHNSRFNIPFFTSEVYNANNVFTAQLSNSSGNFENPTTIGTLQAASGNMIDASIPQSVSAGSGYYVRVISSSPAYISTSSCNSLTVYSLPDVTISGNSSVCENNSATYTTTTVSNCTNQWNVIGGTINGASDGNTVEIIWGSNGLGSVNLTKTNSVTGCSASNILTVTINPLPNSDFTGLTDVCVNSHYTYYAVNTQGVNYNWSLSGGNIIGSANNYSIEVQWTSQTPGTLTLTEVNPLTGCHSSTSKQINIIPLPTPVIDGTLEVCEYNTYTYSVNPEINISNNWTVSGGTIIGAADQNNVIVNWGINGSGLISLRQNNQITDCSNTATQTITLNPLPAANVQGPTTVCINSVQTYTTTSSSDLANVWSVEGGTIIGAANGSSIQVRWGNGTLGTVHLIQTYISTGCQKNGSLNVQIEVFNSITTIYNECLLPLCSNVTLPYTVNYDFSAGNNFVALLSDANGSFTSTTTEIGRVEATESGNINCYIPYSLTTGTHYRIRVNGTNPAITGFDNGKDIQIFKPTLSLTHPNGFETLIPNNSYTIRWVANGVSNLQIYFTRDYHPEGNTIWETLTPNPIPASPGEFVWTVPNIITANCRIKIVSNTCVEASDESNNNFAITDATLTLTSPNGNEIWDIGSNHNITWHSYKVNTVNIEYSVDGGVNFYTVTKSYPAANGVYNWIVPQNPTENCIIRISDADIYYPLDLQDLSDNSLALTGVVITEPNGGEQWFIGSNKNIQWVSAGIENVNLYYSTNEGTNWNLIINSYPASANNYSWQVPNEPSDKCLIKIMDSQNSIYQDISDGNSSFTGLILTAPTGGEQIVSGSVYTITWMSESVETIKIEFIEGTNTITLASHLPAQQGYYLWTVPKNITNPCKIVLSYQVSSTDPVSESGWFTVSGTGISINKPALNDILIINEEAKIEWTSFGVKNINIDYSIDGGKTYYTVTKNYPAANGFYNWMVAAPASTECYVRITDSDISSIVSVSNMFNIGGGLYPVPTSWTFHISSENSTIIVPYSIEPRISGRTIDDGDAIGVFYLDAEGNLKCAGFTIWTNDQNMAITAWGDDGNTPEKDGFSANETYYYKVWDAKLGVELIPYVEYLALPYSLTSTSPDEFSNNNISVISKLETNDKFLLQIPKGWWMISSNLKQTNTQMSTILNDILCEMDLIKDDQGRAMVVSHPSCNITANSIYTWSMTNGYQIHTLEPVTLTMHGLRITPTSYSRSLTAYKWYIVPYLAYTQLTPRNALNSVMYYTYGTPNLLLAKNSRGEIYFPDYAIDQIRFMNPGEAYKLITRYTTSLVYPTTTSSVSQQSVSMGIVNNSEIFNNEPKYNVQIKETGNNATIVVESPDLFNGDEVAVLSNSGAVIGSAVVGNQRAVITIWGDNSSSEDVIEGALENEYLKLRYYDYYGKTEYEFEITSLIDLVKGNQLANNLKYNQDAILLAQAKKGNIISSVEECGTGLSISVEPTPANNYVMFNYSLPLAGKVEIKLYNSMGEQVSTVVEEWKEAGAYKLNFNTSNLQSGMYYYQFIVNEEQQFGKILIVR